MSPSTSSAEPQELYSYSDRMVQLDNELVRHASRLHRSLQRFESRCRESGLRISVSHVHSHLGDIGREAEDVDRWVRTVGKGFQDADRFCAMIPPHLLRPHPWFRDMARDYLEVLRDWASEILAEWGDDLVSELIEQVGGEEAGPVLALLLELFQPGLAAELGLDEDGITAPISVPEDGRSRFERFYESFEHLQEFQFLLTHRTHLRHMMYEGGRILNAVTGTRGHVTKAKDLYDRLITHKYPYRHGIDKVSRIGGATYVLAGVGAVLGTYSDLKEDRYHGDVAKTVGVNVIHEGMNVAIGATGVGAVVLTANAAVQIGGNVLVGAQEKTARAIAGGDTRMEALLLEDTARSRDALERADLKNVTRELAETLYDGSIGLMVDDGKAVFDGVSQLVKNPSWDTLKQVSESTSKALLDNRVKAGARMVEGVVDTGLAAINVVDGLSDFVASQASTIVSQKVAGMNRVVQDMPFLSDEFKDAVDSTAKSGIEIVHDITDLRNGLINVEDWGRLDLTPDGD